MIQRVVSLSVTVCVLVVCVQTGCRRDDSPHAPPPLPEPQRALLLFPDELKVEDASVNAFVTRVMEACSADDYESCRLLWSATTEPISREQFEHGWRAVTQMRILGIQALPTREGDTVYAIHAYVALDASALPPEQEATRQVVLVGVRELGEWRLARAPKEVREWMLTQQYARSAETASPDPTDESPD